MIDYRQAREMVLAQARSFGREEVPLDQAFGRVVSGTVRADRDYPPFPRATMDGYALRYADLEGGMRRFRVVDTVLAGGQTDLSIEVGECYKIMTGGAVPPSADIVIRRENVEEGVLRANADKGGAFRENFPQGGQFIQLAVSPVDPLPAGTLPAPADPSFPWRPFQNIARQGEDLAAGDIVIDGAVRCEPPVIGLLATLGRRSVTVERLPRVGLLTTGNEVVPVDSAVSPVQIRNSNRWLLEAALRKAGVPPAVAAHVADDRALIRAKVQQLLDHDLLIVCGGVSAGDADHVPAALEEAGVQKLFHKIAIRPGKPTWCGVAPGGKMVFALPGNPFSTFVNMTLLVHPFLEACYGLRPPAPLGVPLGAERKKRSPLDEFFPVQVHGSPVRADAVALNGSGDIRLGREANALALHPAGSGLLAAGTGVKCFPLI